MKQTLVRALDYSMKATFPANRRRVRLNVVSGTTAGPNSIVVVNLPENSLIDYKTFEMTCVGSTSGNYNFPPTYALVRRCVDQLGGVSIGGENQHYGQVTHALMLAGTSKQFENSKLFELYNERTDTNLISAQSNKFLVWSDWPLTIAQNSTGGYIHSGISGHLSRQIQLTGVESLQGKLGNTTPGNFQLNDIRCYVDVIDIDPMSLAVQSLRSVLDSEGGQLEMVVPNVKSLIVRNSSSEQFHMASSSLDMLLTCPLESGYDNAVNVKEENVDYNKFLSFRLQDAGGSSVQISDVVPSGNLKYYWQIGSNSYPQEGSSAMVYGILETIKTMGSDSVFNYNKLFYIENQTNNTAFVAANNNQLFEPEYEKYSINNVFEQNTVFIQALSLEGSAFNHARGVKTGVDTSGANSSIRWNSLGVRGINNWLLTGIGSASLLFSGGQVVSIVY